MGQGNGYLGIELGQAITEFCQELLRRRTNDALRPENPAHPPITHVVVWDPVDRDAPNHLLGGAYGLVTELVEGLGIIDVCDNHMDFVTQTRQAFGEAL